jgi:hypothetical protein
MAFKEPNLVYSDDPTVAAAATRLLRRRNSGTTTRDSNCKVLWMGAECALVKDNPFSYGGESYSGTVSIVSIQHGKYPEQKVHICGHQPFTVGRGYTGDYGRLSDTIFRDLIRQAPTVYAAIVASSETYKQEREERYGREKAERKQKEQELAVEASKQERDRTVASRMEILWNFAIHWPAKYRHAIEACLDADSDFDRASIHRSVE